MWRYVSFGAGVGSRPRRARRKKGRIAAAAVLAGDHPGEAVEGIEEPQLGIVPAMALDGELSPPAGRGDDVRELAVRAAGAVGEDRAPGLHGVGIHAVERDRDQVRAHEREVVLEVRDVSVAVLLLVGDAHVGEAALG